MPDIRSREGIYRKDLHLAITYIVWANLTTQNELNIVVWANLTFVGGIVDMHGRCIIIIKNDY